MLKSQNQDNFGICQFSVLWAVAITILLPSLCWSAPQDESDLWKDRTRHEIYILRGGSLPAKKIVEKSEDGRNYLVIQTPRGGLLKLDKARVIRGELERDALVNDYRRRVDALDPNSAVGHLETAEWIRKMNGTRKLADELEFHLREAVRIDPKIDKAWKLLGYKEINGDWFLPANKWENHGYIRAKSGRGWIPQRAVERNQKIEEFDNQLGEQKKLYQKWKRAIPKYGNDQVAMERDLASFLSPRLIKEIDPEMRKAPVPLRLIFVGAMGQVNAGIAQEALIYYAVQDPDLGVRDRALTMLKQEKYNQALIAQIISSRLLVSKQNPDINRSAEVIRELGQKNTILPLIDALQTQHKFKNPNAPRPGSINSTFDRTGRGNGLAMPGNQQQMITKSFNNEAVLRTLREFTDQDFGYDEGLWKAWYTTTQTAQVQDLRGGGR